MAADWPRAGTPSDAGFGASGSRRSPASRSHGLPFPPWLPLRWLVRETFREETEIHSGEDGARALRCLAWTWDPDSADDTFVTDYALLLRDGVEVTAVHDRHVEGLFPKATWLRVLSSAGYRVEMAERPLGEGKVDEIFLALREA
jgi:hypothetical protein